MEDSFQRTLVQINISLYDVIGGFGGRGRVTYLPVGALLAIQDFCLFLLP